MNISTSKGVLIKGVDKRGRKEGVSKRGVRNISKNMSKNRVYLLGKQKGVLIERISLS